MSAPLTCELIGGPKDGDVVAVEDEVYWGHGEIYFPASDTAIEPVAAYRWIFGAAGHLDFIGYEVS
jgi:hypothetical protein